MLPIPVLSIHDLSTVRSGYGPLMKVSARSAGGQVCILHLARFNDFPGAKIVAIEPMQKTKPREKMVYFSLTAKFEWLTLVRPAATARAHSRSRNAFGEETLTSCLTSVGGPEIGWGVRQKNDELLPIVFGYCTVPGVDGAAVPRSPKPKSKSLRGSLWTKMSELGCVSNWLTKLVTF